MLGEGVLRPMLLAACAAGFGCVTDHDALAKKPGSSEGGAGGEGGSPSFGGFPSGATGGSDDEPRDPEPDGPTVIQLLHGAVDAPRLAFCFARVEDGAVEASNATPVPPAGLSYGHSLTLAEFEDLDLASDTVAVSILGGDLAPIEGMTCTEALAFAEEQETIDTSGGAGAGQGGAASGGATGQAGASGAPPNPALAGAGGTSGDPMGDPNALRARPLAAIPAGTLSGARSYLLAVTGCLGGQGFDDGNGTEACGEGYSPPQPYLLPLLVKLSRINGFGRLGVQVVHAARAGGEVDVRALPPAGSNDFSITLATGVRPGEVLPFPPETDYSRTELGLGRPLRQLAVYLNQGQAFQTSWANALKEGALDDVEDGQNHALVLIGPRPNLVRAPFWNEPDLVLVPANPEL